MFFKTALTILKYMATFSFIFPFLGQFLYLLQLFFFFFQLCCHSLSNLQEQFVKHEYRQQAKELGRGERKLTDEGETALPLPARRGKVSEMQLVNTVIPSEPFVGLGNYLLLMRNAQRIQIKFGEDFKFSIGRFILTKIKTPNIAEFSLKSNSDRNLGFFFLTFYTLI